MELSATYIYDRTPLMLLFGTGYLLYRVVALAGLPESLASRATRLSRGRADLLMLSLMAVSAGLSMFIANAVTVLAMIPVIRRLDKETEGLTTPLTLSVIYGANIGGVGSLIGSPANLLLIGALDFFNVPGGEQITFFNWFKWALPLVLLLLLLAWLIVRFSIPVKGRKQVVEVTSGNSLQRKERKGLFVFSAYLLFWSFSSLGVEFAPFYAKYEPLAAIIFFIFFAGYIFSTGMIRAVDLISGIPGRGILFLGLLGGLIVLVRILELDKLAARLFTELLGKFDLVGDGHFVLYLVTALTVILLTEFLSNTIVSTAFFAVMVHVANSYNLDPLPLMVLVSAASTCAFMTPVATPCNSLAVGEMRGISLKTMFGLGFILNLSGALLIAFWTWKVIPLVYR